MKLLSTPRVNIDAKSKQCVFLELTRPMDSVTSSDEGDWAERKELENNERYGMHLYFINYLSAFNGRPWNCSHTPSSQLLSRGPNSKPDSAFSG